MKINKDRLKRDRDIFELRIAMLCEKANEFKVLYDKAIKDKEDAEKEYEQFEKHVVVFEKRNG